MSYNDIKERNKPTKWDKFMSWWMSDSPDWVIGLISIGNLALLSIE
jgi:hypothetical protein